ncbi:MAG: hypothetical protein KAQ65_05355 [Candidatus Thorarchaeota archaeon]|nr:hypothetical protein [Candidatus Thorarchaeota archaeon]MCK5238147.1 hypothetical protein [Candidatus Thorarchaeota archaeon]
MTITDKPEVIDKEVVPEEVPETKKEPASQIVQMLEKTGHKTSTYPNGVIVGVNLEGIKGARGVHVDTVLVIDWDRKLFTGTTLGIQSTILEVLSRDLVGILSDLGLADNYTVATRRTLRGTLEVERLKPRANVQGSMIHQTKTVYVVYREARPSVDLSWLTDDTRVVHENQFHMCRVSDRRSNRAEVEQRVKVEKWDTLQRGVTLGQLSMLLLVFGVSGALGLILALLNGTSWIIPVSAGVGGGILSLLTAFLSRKTIDEFTANLEEEEMSISRVGDGERLRMSMRDNKQVFDRIRDLAFTISPLMARVGGSIQIGDLDGAVELACLVLDELVRKSLDSKKGIGDEGLAKFLGLFKSLDPEFDEAGLSICYVGLSNHADKPLQEAEAIAYNTTLLDSLQRVGAIRPDIRDRIEDKMNSRSMKSSAVEMEKNMELLKEEDEERIRQAQVISDNREEEFEGDDDTSLIDEISKSNLESQPNGEVEVEEVLEELEITGAEVVIKSKSTPSDKADIDIPTLDASKKKQQRRSKSAA